MENQIVSVISDDTPLIENAIDVIIEEPVSNPTEISKNSAENAFSNL